MIATYKITPRAREDLKNIGRYTEHSWGRTQRNTYLKKLEERIIWLAKNPQLGKHRNEITDGFYSFIEKQAIHIIGIPHKDMDIVSYFQPDIQ